MLTDLIRETTPAQVVPGRLWLWQCSRVVQRTMAHHIGAGNRACLRQQHKRRCAGQDQRLRNARMKWPKWSIATGDSGDFLPIMIGCIFVFLSLPPFVLLLVMPDRNSGVIGIPLL